MVQGFETAGRAAVKLGTTRDALGRLTGAVRETSGQLQGAGRAASGLAREVGQAARAESSLSREARTTKRELDETAKAGGRLANALTRAGTAGKTAFGAIRGIGQAGAGLAAGAAASAAVAGHVLAKPIAYQARLANMANVAYQEKDAAGRIAGMEKLDATIRKGSKEGGVSRDVAAETLNAMFAQGMEEGSAQRLLPRLTKAGTASNSDSKDLATIANTGMQLGYYGEDRAIEAIEKVVKGGELGKFEAKDMGKWMPQLMAVASGMKNMQGFERIIASLQGIAVVTGSNDQAGNALFNLLGKITSQDTEKDFAAQGINLKKSLSHNVAKGMDPLTAFVAIVEKEILSKDKDFQAIKKKIAVAKNDPEKKALLEQASEIIQKGALGKILQDREASLGFTGLTTQKDRIADVLAGLKNSKGAIDTGFAVVSSTTEFKQQQLANEKDTAMSQTLENIGPALNSVIDGATTLAREFPGLATVVAETSSAVGVFSAGLLAAGGYRMLTGAGAAAAGGGIAASAAGLARGAVSGAARLAPWALGATAAWDIYRTEKDATLTRAQKNIAHSETYGATGGALAGAAGGAALGSVVPGLGTAIGAILGALGGWFAGGMAGRQTGKWLYEPSTETLEAAKELVVKDERAINFNAQLNVDGREMARVVNKYNAFDALRD